jgi:GntR family transcriptional regulator
MQLATSYVPWSLAEGTQMIERDSGPGGIYSRLADVGHGPVRFTEEVATRMSTPRKPGSPGSRTLSQSSTSSERLSS